MTKVRVHEYAKRVKKTSKEIIDELGKLNVNVTNHMSTIDEATISKLDKSYGGKKTSTGAPKAAPAKPRQEQK